MSDDFIFTSESVTIGHPDKLCDQISDAIVDHFLRHDPDARIVAECAVASGVLFISAHFASQTTPLIADTARQVIRGVGYPREVFNADACTIMTSFMDHSARDYLPLNLEALDEAGLAHITPKHQVTVFGYACDQTPAMMPLPIWLAHRLAERLDSPAVKRALPYLLPDGKTQVAIEYRNGEPLRIHSITLVTSQSEDAGVSPGELREAVIATVIEPVLVAEGYRAAEGTQLFVNPEGPLIGGGPAAHAGLTGRKTGIDTYGEYSRHSGAGLSGKDPMRIDRVGAYIARYAAKNLVAAGLARECEVQLSYSIGVAEPVSVRVRTFGTGAGEDRGLEARLREVVDFRLAAIVRDLGLRKLPGQHPGGFYRRLATYGQVGRIDLDLPWERTDRAETLR
ncbi:MAG: methionine adenosyltransferase [Chromatiaceae bacterium]|jgi:S-adenosylmethionine synthetase|nr:methionine adenosyltransferase [Chromatiaceae bacterium]